jgi:superfamily II DNA helicase RecQ
MQIKIFTIPIYDNGIALNEMNAFMRANKILEVQNQLVTQENGVYWCFCVKYIESKINITNQSKAKIDYKNVLDDETFKKFSKLREIRKKVAADEGLSAFIIFTDEELAQLASLNEITEKNMLSVKGIGEKKVERFAKYFINTQNNETAR